uniref:Uncharacterized protein n=1 Tax=Candidatus Kentrum sp. TUN TaxID=2126343 RepID=A0A450ZXJ3_9GAMM|nr:MAG: hypothetical protein BECKTUN1418F_GA0071002_114513 [Candidatus Kentron sp. TUN]VFK64996.1 MAG: hypothetical protein BECKTUN1418D_GA0071000_13053 [Candidatus Kentron sp. TUN]VFK67371.1 MAG: hypothetical protein BECKTUN1418E_GA0071001_114313 [Candidatus Kentron sp. TUN]
MRRNLLAESALRERLLVTAASRVAITNYRAEVDRDAALDSVLTALDSLYRNFPIPYFRPPWMRVLP